MPFTAGGSSVRMYRSLRDPASRVEVEIDGARIAVCAGISVAAAMLEADALPSRMTAVSASPRAPYCMMGVCFDCLVEIDGVPNRQGCMVAVADGMRIRRQRGAPVTGTP